MQHLSEGAKNKEYFSGFTRQMLGWLSGIPFLSSSAMAETEVWVAACETLEASPFSLKVFKKDGHKSQLFENCFSKEILYSPLHTR